MSLLTPITPITPISGNDRARCLDVIRSAEREHWFSGLRQAELEILALQRTLKNWPILDRIRQFFTGQKSPHRRDVEYQLSLYQAEYKRILDEHPEAQSLSYEELQSRYGTEALNARKSTCVATATLMRQFGISEAAAQLLVTAAPEDLQAIVAGSVSLSHSVSQQLALASGVSDSSYAAALLSSMSNEQRHAAIAEAQALAALKPGES
jgi:hypothetical protein